MWRGTALPDETVASIVKNRVAIKGPLATPIGGNHDSPNVALQKRLNLYANVRPAKNLPGIATPFKDVDIVVIRENSEDLYSGIELVIVPGVVQALKIITEVACTRIARFAFAYAVAHNRKKVTAVHKANIMRMSDVDAVFLYLNDGMAAPSRLEWYSAVCRRFGEGAVIVLDDLPALLPGDALAERLEYLARACRDARVSLVTTSVHRLPGPLLRATRGMVVEKAVPPLTDIEALELLRAYGGPPTLLADMARVRFLNNVARRHPSLLSAVALYLSTQDWQWTDQHLTT